MTKFSVVGGGEFLVHDAGSQAVSGVLQKLQTQMWKASRKGVSTFTQHFQGAL